MSVGMSAAFRIVTASSSKQGMSTLERSALLLLRALWLETVSTLRREYDRWRSRSAATWAIWLATDEDSFCAPPSPRTDLNLTALGSFRGELGRRTLSMRPECECGEVEVCI